MRKLAWAIIGTLIVLLLSPRAARAEILSSHAFAGELTIPGPSYPVPQPVLLEGNGMLDTGLQSYQQFNGSSHISGSAQAITDIQADRFLRAYASTSDDGADRMSGGEGVSSWRDVVFVNSPIHPDVLRLNFVVDGDLAAATTFGLGFGQTKAGLGITTSIDPRDFFGEPTGSAGPGTSLGIPDLGIAFGNQYQATLGSDYTNAASYFSTSGAWDSYSFIGGHFFGSFHIDIPYDEALGGYGWGVKLDAITLAMGGTAETNALDTLTLQSVGLTDGTPVSVTFESGLQLGASAVPEPSSVVMLGFGAIGLIGAVVRCNRASA